MSEERPKKANPQAPTADVPPRPVEVAARPEPPASLPRSIGGYHIKQVIDSGGMGTVYLAIQEKPRRTVALKVMRKGIASKSALRRFEFESQILARLKHPCIAEVYEAGTHDDGTGGVPYFAMEYIANAKPITEYARSKGLTTRQRLELFAKVCEGIHHGHQKGIIHRDLKPGNILVDASGQPKVIDFGVARATDSDMAITTLQTDIGQLIGTLQYMSPEQCDADPHALDTRSDVYALGVVLYELLCGRLPYDVGSAAVYDAARMVREQAPAKPSTLDRALRGDVETITLKALEKDKERRYQSASELASDIRRYLRNEPIMARPPSIGYQFRKFANRNKAAVIGAVAVLVVLVAGTVVSVMFALGEARARSLAETRRGEAEQQAAIAAAVNDFLNNDLLAWRDPDRAQGREMTVGELIDTAAAKIGGKFADQPSAEAQLRQTIGRVYFALGRYPEADRHLQRALRLRHDLYGEDSLEAAETMETIAFTRGRWHNDMSESIELEAQVVRIRERLLGDEHPLTNRARGDLAMFTDVQRGAASAGLDNVVLMQMLAAVRGKGETPDQVRVYLDGLIADVDRLWADGKKEEAIAMVEAVSEPFLASELLRERIPWAVAGFGQRLQMEQRPAAAVAVASAAVRMGETHLTERHTNTIYAIEALGRILVKQGRLGEAEPWLVRGYELSQEVWDPEDEKALVAMTGLAYLYIQQERYAEAESMLLEQYEIVKAAYPPNHALTVDAIKDLVSLYETSGQADKSREWRAKLAQESGERE